MNKHSVFHLLARQALVCIDELLAQSFTVCCPASRTKMTSAVRVCFSVTVGGNYF